MRVPAEPVEAREFEFRRVEARGAYVPDSTVLLDNRIHAGRVGYEVVMPLRLGDSRMHVLVNRGWIAGTGDRTRLPDGLTSLSLPKNHRAYKQGTGRIDRLHTTSRFTSPAVRITVSKVLLLVVAIAAAYVTSLKPGDILFLVGAAFSLAASAFFPALVMGVFWKRANKWGAIVGMMAGLGLLPAALSHGIGSETQRPFALVVVGGMISALAVALWLLPVVYSFITPKRLKTPEEEDEQIMDEQ